MYPRVTTSPTQTHDILRLMRTSSPLRQDVVWLQPAPSSASLAEPVPLQNEEAGLEGDGALAALRGFGDAKY